MPIPVLYQPRPTALTLSRESPGDDTLVMDMVVHDLGNLVQIAASAISIVGRDPGIATSATLDRAMIEARASLDRAGELIRDSLGGRPNMIAEEVEVEESLDTLRPLLERLCDSTIRLEIRTERLPRIACRRLDFENAVLNLALNAREAMPEGGVLTITAEVADGPEIPEIQLVVADTGVGMPPQLAAIATQPLFTTKSDGRGIGLTSVARFVARADGRLLIDSKPGTGTAVTMRLPAAGTWLLG